MKKPDLSGWTGKTIIKVDQTGPAMKPDEAIVVLTFAGGERVRLQATELGAWVTELPPEGKAYSTWDSLMREYSEQAGDEKPDVEVQDTAFLQFTCPSTGERYRLSLRSPTMRNVWTERVLSHPQGLALLRDAAVCGAYWQLCFDHQAVQDGRVPDELELR